MSNRSNSLVWITVCALACAACGDKKDSNSGTKAGTGGGAGTGAAAGMGGDALCVPPGAPETRASSAPIEYFCDDKPTTHAGWQSACRNASDCEIIDSGEVRELAKNCGLGCRSFTDCDEAEKCNKECVVNETRTKIMEPGLTEGCAKCYTDIVMCGLVYCLSECAASADDPACVKCQLTSGCREVFETCAGLDRTN